MGKEVSKQNSFRRTRENESKMGAFYTDPQHCRWMGQFLVFPKDLEVCCLDPSIGDAEAICQVTGKNERENIKLFGVELNHETCQGLNQKEGLLEELLEADFIDGVIISHNSFSFCFMNPPYGTSSDGVRLENLFLGKVIPYLMLGAVLICVVPVYVAKSTQFARRWCSNFETLHYYRFHPDEFKKYQQVVLFGRRKKQDMQPEEISRLIQVEVDELEELPAEYNGERIAVLPSKKEDIKTYICKHFNAERVLDTVSKSALQDIMRKKLKTPAYGVGGLGRPPIMPCNNQLYLLAMCGGGEGLAGSEENKDLHLQRGIVKRVSETSYERDEQENLVETERISSKLSFNLIESGGTITELV